MKEPRFEYIDRHKKRLAVLISGWAMDGRIFDKLDINYNYLVPMEVTAENFFEKLEETLLALNQKTILIGWSFGGLLAAHFTVTFPEMVEKAIFVSVKENYSQSEIDKMKEYLERNKTMYLKGFYRKCFSGQTDDERKWFTSKILDKYLKEMDTEMLNSQLDFLKFNYLPIISLKTHSKKLIFVHGDKDAVIPIIEVDKIRKYLPGAYYVTIKDTGHVPFLNPEFKNILEKYHE
ncbi:MAG: alpha/beta hydrolase [Candidatus Omnitrophota bacterium]